MGILTPSVGQEWILGRGPARGGAVRPVHVPERPKTLMLVLVLVHGRVARASELVFEWLMPVT